MEKKIIILIIVIFVLILGVGGFFYLWQGRMAQKAKEIEKREEVAEEKVIETFGDIVVKETPKGKIVENKKEGISMKVPEGWILQLPTDVQEPVSFYSPELVQGEQGEEYMCKIETSVSDGPMDINALQKKWQEETREWYTVIKDEYSVINIQRYQALKNISETVEGGFSINIAISTENKLYSFVVYSYPQYKEKCSKKLDEFLGEVSIE